jgi:hypothetical protein
VAGTKAHQCCEPAEERVVNMISLLLIIFDWPIIMIGSGGLLLVVPCAYLLSPAFNFMGGVTKK